VLANHPTATELHDILLNDVDSVCDCWEIWIHRKLPIEFQMGLEAKTY